MSTTNTAPSLLSRLSPLPLEPRAPPSKHNLNHTSRSPFERSGGLAIAHAAVRAASGDAAGHAFLSTSTSPGQSYSPSRSETSRGSFSPRKPTFGSRTGGAGGGSASHLSSLPDDVLQKAQPIPAGRGTNSSRWASSGSPASPPSRNHPVKKGFSPMLSSTTPSGSSPPPIAATTPSTSPALQQIEVMLSQLRTTPSKSAAASPPQQAPTFPQTRPSSSPSKPSLTSSSLSSSRPDSFLSRSPVKNHLPATPDSDGPRQTGTRAPNVVKRPALGGKSRWARDSDEEPEPVELGTAKASEERAKHDKESEGESKPTKGDEREETEVKREEEGNAVTRQTEVEEPSAPPEAAAPSRTLAPTLGSDMPPFEPPSIEPPATTPFHFTDWADAEDDELPDLDDWGVSTTEPFVAPPVAVEPPPLSPTLSSTSTLSTRSKRHRRRNSAASSNGAPPLPSDAIRRPPPHQPPPPARNARPPKPVTNRLFNSARAAAIPPPNSQSQNHSPAPPQLARQLPPHQRPRPPPPSSSDFASSKPPPTQQASDALDSNWRSKGAGPSPALFSKLSGMGPPKGTSPAPTTKGGENGSSRRSRRGRSRTSSAAGETLSVPPAMKSEKPPKPIAEAKATDDGGWTKVGGGGTRSSRWA